ncbi:DUF4064 domain-containing protein [Aureivirga sp. CE67]|uniref:DUF4064 domain-containing protein n=1 Tax=Aureivirga sp. CE67 TaxID=1788983 RepID=UPI0018C9986C|nr:DUF4064 domain-containing protein [Aureivirga sp. CE67]
MSQRGTSSAPLVLGIIGGVLGIPGSLCSPYCALGMDKMKEFVETFQQDGGQPDPVEVENYVNQLAENPDFKFGSIMLWVLLISGILGLIGGILGKPKPQVSGILMFIAAVTSLAGFFVGNYLNVLVGVLFAIGGMIAFKQTKENANDFIQ